MLLKFLKNIIFTAPIFVGLIIIIQGYFYFKDDGDTKKDTIIKLEFLVFIIYQLILGVYTVSSL